MISALNDDMHSLLESLVQSGQEEGLQVAAYKDGALVVDAWAGVADSRTGRLVTSDTLFTCWSVTKGLAATCVYLLIERGRTELDAPIASFWPAFARCGKDSATVRHALTHRIGIPEMPADASKEMIVDWARMSKIIERQKPVWAPGARIGYHAWTFGWIIGEIVRRIDGRPIERFLREEILDPLGIEDFYLGVPDAAEPRVAHQRHEPPSGVAPLPSALWAKTLPPAITNADTLNDPAVRRAVLPAVGGVTTARAVARHYAMLANGGELNGVRTFSSRTLEAMRAFDSDVEDAVLGLRVRRGVGYYLGGAEVVFGDERMGISGLEFGHPGLGGSIGFADPEKRFAFALTKTLIKGPEERRKSAAYLAAELIRARL